MKRAIAIIAGEPNSISSEIIFKSWNLKKKYPHKPFFIIGSINLIFSQMKKMKYKIKIKEIKENFQIKELLDDCLPIYNVDYKQKKPFEKISSKSSKYIFKCFDSAIKFAKNKKIVGFINCPVSKEALFEKKHQGITEFISSKIGKKGDEVMLIYNKKLSVVPVTTHIPIKLVSKNIKKDLIIEKVKTVNRFYEKFFKKSPKIAILGLNPHNFSNSNKFNEQEIINKSIKKLLKLKIKVVGPIAADSSFVVYKKYKFDIIVGMYHDQVLGPFKALFKFDAINITLGLSYLRVSPDHGVGENIVGKKIANPYSLIKSIKFFNYIN